MNESNGAPNEESQLDVRTAGGVVVSIVNYRTGALTVGLAWLLRLPMRRAFALATAGHALLEAQEIASDVLFGYRNVRGWWDTADDLGSGLVGSATYGALYVWLVRRPGREPETPLGCA